MKYNQEKRMFLINKFLKLESVRLVQRAYRTEYVTSIAPADSTIRNIVSNFQKTGSVNRKVQKSRKKPVRTKALIESIKNLYVEDNKISLRKIANIVPASISTIRNVAKTEFKLKPYKAIRKFCLYKNDYQRRLDFVEFVRSRRLNVETLLICSDEAFFYLHGGHNLQNNRIWAEFQPNYINEKPLNDDKVMVWCAFSTDYVYGPYFFDDTVNGERYLAMLKYFFWPMHSRLKSKKKLLSILQHDGAPPHRKKEVDEYLESKFGDRFIGSGIWPPRSPDLNPCDFSLWGSLKSKVYNPKPNNVQELRNNIEQEIKNFKKLDRKSIFSNLKKNSNY